MEISNSVLKVSLLGDIHCIIHLTIHITELEAQNFNVSWNADSRPKLISRTVDSHLLHNSSITITEITLKKKEQKWLWLGPGWRASASHGLASGNKHYSTQKIFDLVIWAKRRLNIF